uniref:N-acetyltransferase domain-containing protein n=1 Tax=Cannabis sativa TaxID=3483 RepID=A0A803PZS9_CANSA
MNLSKITLRPFKLTDVDDLMIYAGDDQVTRHLRRKTLTSKDEALTFLKHVCNPHYHHWHRSICIDDRSIGYISALPGSGESMFKAEMSAGAAAEYWGQGVVTKAMKIAVDQLFKDFPHLVRLEGFVDVKNTACQRVMDKVGFRKEGLLRSHYFLKGRLGDYFIYSILATDFLPVSKL